MNYLKFHAFILDIFCRFDWHDFCIVEKNDLSGSIIIFIKVSAVKNSGITLSLITECILLVDDDDAMRSVLKRHLASFGLQADAANSGTEAVRLMQDNQYGLLITDISMPEMDGMELIGHATTNYPEMDILALSGYSELYSFTDLVTAGATDFMAKPFQRNELQAKLQRIFRERSLRDALAESREKEKNFLFSIVESLAMSLDEKDEYTHGHSRRVTHLSIQLAEHTAEKDIDLELLRLSGVLHDVGKIGIPDKILTKAGNLTDEEFDAIKKHPVIGAQILQPMQSNPRMVEIINIIKHHHECYDGTGYPDGLQGEEIPYLARIIAIADSFDAMTSDRPYRKRRDVASALAEIRDNCGSQFDPQLGKMFVELMENSTSPPLYKTPGLLTPAVGQLNTRSGKIRPSANRTEGIAPLSVSSAT